MIKERDKANAAGKSDSPASEKSDEEDGRADGGHDIAGKPHCDDMPEDDDRARDSKRDQGERNEGEGTTATAQKGPAGGGQSLCAPDAFHESGDDAGCLKEADEDGEDERVIGTGAVWRGIEVALEQRCDIGRKDRCEELGELRANGSGVRKKGDDCGSDDEDGKERNDGRVSGCLSEIKEVMIQRVNECAAEDGGDAEVSSHGFFP